MTSEHFIHVYNNSILDGFLAVGSFGNFKAELYNFGTSSWTTTTDFPFGVNGATGLIDFNMIYIPEDRSYLVIGGMAGADYNQIAQFKDGEWSDVGRLNSARSVSFKSFCICDDPTLSHTAPSG